MSERTHDFLIGFLQYCAYGVGWYFALKLYRGVYARSRVLARSFPHYVHDPKWWEAVSFVTAIFFSLFLMVFLFILGVLNVPPQSSYFIELVLIGLFVVLFLALDGYYFCDTRERD